MTTPQAGIFALGTRFHHHIELDVDGSIGDLGARLSRISAAATTASGANLVIGFGSRVWTTLAPDDAPSDLVAFEPVGGPDGFEMPATQHDLWLWIHGPGPDVVFDLARAATHELAGVASIAAEQPAFTYHASQDLTGFEDGTENPPINEAAAVASIAEGQPAAGGSIVLIQRWVHDLDRFADLAVPEQEQVIGRTLADSVELDGDRQDPRSHVSRVVVHDHDGEELEVFRRSVAFGDLAEHGLLFVAFSADRARLATMLERMTGADGCGRDRLTEYSTPTSGAWYIAPSIESLATIGA